MNLFFLLAKVGEVLPPCSNPTSLPRACACPLLAAANLPPARCAVLLCATSAPPPTPPGSHLHTP